LRASSLGSRAFVFFLNVLFRYLLFPFPSFTRIGTPTTVTCQLRIWLLVLGFAISYGSLFMKNWRIYRLYTDASMKIIRITNGYLFVRVVAVVIIYIIYLAVWTGVDPQRSEFKPSIYFCASSSNLWLIFQGVLVLLFLLIGVVLAIRTRNIPQLYNECRYIGLSVRSTFFFFSSFLRSFILHVIADPPLYFWMTDVQFGVLLRSRCHDKFLPVQHLR
jgi:hypothetical protein